MNNGDKIACPKHDTGSQCFFHALPSAEMEGRYCPEEACIHYKKTKEKKEIS